MDTAEKRINELEELTIINYPNWNIRSKKEGQNKNKLKSKKPSIQELQDNMK